MRPPAYFFSAAIKQNRPIRLLGCGRTTKIHTFPSNRSFPSSGGPGVSTRTLCLGVQRKQPPKHRFCAVGYLSSRPQESEFVSSLRCIPAGCNSRTRDAFPESSPESVIEFLAHHADLRSRGRCHRFPSGRASPTSRTHCLVR